MEGSPSVAADWCTLLKIYIAGSFAGQAYEALPAHGGGTNLLLSFGVSGSHKAAEHYARHPLPAERPTLERVDPSRIQTTDLTPSSS